MAQFLAVTRVEKEKIWELVFGQGRTIAEVAKILKRNRDTIAKHLHSEEGKEAEKKIYDSLGRAARGRLARSASRAADSWLTQLDLADQGLRANHLPAKDLLTHVGAVDIAVPNTAKGTQIIIQIGTGSPEDIEADVIDITPERNRLEP